MRLTTYTAEGGPDDVVRVTTVRARELLRGGAAQGATPDDAVLLDVLVHGA